MLGVGLREHHQLDVVRVAAEGREGLDEVVDFVLGEGEAEASVGGDQRGAAGGEHRHAGHRARRLVAEEGVAGRRGRRRRPGSSGHGAWREDAGCGGIERREREVRVRIADVDRVGDDALDALHGGEAADVGDVGGLGGPGGDRAGTGGDDLDEAGDCSRRRGSGRRSGVFRGWPRWSRVSSPDVSTTWTNSALTARAGRPADGQVLQELLRGGKWRGRVSRGGSAWSENVMFTNNPGASSGLKGVFLGGTHGHSIFCPRKPLTIGTVSSE